MAEGLTDKARDMCKPCGYRGPDGSCSLAWVSLADQNKRARSGWCGDAARLGEDGVDMIPRVLFEGQWVFWKLV